MFAAKKSQFLMISGFLFILLLVFIYSIETENSYIVNFAEPSLVDNILYETCKIPDLITNTSNLGPYYGNFSENLTVYCSGLGYQCNLTIVNTTAIPFGGNWSETNASNYNYSLNVTINRYTFVGNFTC